MRSGPPAHEPAAWDEVKPIVNYGKGGHLNMRSVKLFMDGLCNKNDKVPITERRVGALGSWGAALLSPYSDNKSTRGILTTEPGTMRAIVHNAWEAGWQVVSLNLFRVNNNSDTNRTSTLSGTGPTRSRSMYSKNLKIRIPGAFREDGHALNMLRL